MNNWRTRHIAGAAEFSVVAVECALSSYPTFAMSEIDPSTIQAYLETDYRVDAPEAFVLRVGIASAPLAHL